MAKTDKNKNNKNNKNKFDKKNIIIAILGALNFLLLVVSVFVCFAAVANKPSEMDKEKIATHLLSCSAMYSAMFKAKAVFPMAGRAAISTRSAE